MALAEHGPRGGSLSDRRGTSMTSAVRIGPRPVATPGLRLPGSVDEALRDVGEWPADLVPGNGATLRLWELLASLAARDVAVARSVEPHLDAQAILDQAGPTAGPFSVSTWGVFAAESPAAVLNAAQGSDGSWRLDGRKPWCSLADRLDGALVTARMPGSGAVHGLFAVELRSPGVEVSTEAWVSRGLREIPSTSVQFDDVRAQLVRGDDWYLRRAGFWWGGIGVAACWYGGAVGVARRVLAEVRHRSDDRLLTMHLGRIDAVLAAARHSLAHAAAAVDASGEATDGGRSPASDDEREAGRLLARRVRAVVADGCEEVLHRAGHALGPAPLAQEEDHAKRVADLQIYLRQHHAERDDASLGGALAASTDEPW